MGIVGRILVLSKLLEDRVEQVLKPYGIRYTDLDVLATLRRSGGPCCRRPADLLKSVLITSGSMTACIDRLLKGGLVIREANPDDRRSCSVRLTASGKRLIDKAIVSRFDESADAVQSLGKQESKQ